jgi:H+-translocating NAD(P) transhydrogenase subunit alpha
MIVGVLKEQAAETRVSLLPEHIALYTKMQVQVVVETSAGNTSYASDEDYTNAGATIDSRNNILQKAQVILSINALSEVDIANCTGKIILGFYQPLFNAGQIKSLAEKNFTVFSIDMIPRTTRAQSMDVLSSQANIAGYKAVLLAANTFPKYFPMFMTAAGSIPPAKMLILGAGVAGLQAIATAKRLGAVVEVFDTRPQVKEEVMSLGAKLFQPQPYKEKKLQY